jgi:hypothetical protein
MVAGVPPSARGGVAADGQQAERALFFARKAELGIDGQWGLFAMKIPGRVGYQCANFYRCAATEGERVGRV